MSSSSVVALARSGLPAVTTDSISMLTSFARSIMKCMCSAGSTLASSVATMRTEWVLRGALQIWGTPCSRLSRSASSRSQSACKSPPELSCCQTSLASGAIRWLRRQVLSGSRPNESPPALPGRTARKKDAGASRHSMPRDVLLVGPQPLQKTPCALKNWSPLSRPEESALLAPTKTTRMHQVVGGHPAPAHMVQRSAATEDWRRDHDVIWLTEEE